MTEREEPGNRADDARAPDEGRTPGSYGSNEPVAIVGMACRFPGADGISAFWRLLEEGGNAVQEGVPGSGIGRIGALFPDDTGQIHACRFGAYLDPDVIERFDAAFFRISPVEAQLLDPQQRLILETSWRALEDAGIDPDLLKDSRTGVYAGISNNDYRGLILEASEDTGSAEPAASLYAVTGTSLNTAIGRVAFALGLGGPAMAVDTACSSSLVATHQAVSGLQRGDADIALAGGVKRHSLRSASGVSGQRGDVGAGWPMQDLRCLRQRICQGRGLRHRGAQAAHRCGGRRRPHMGGHPGHGTEPGRGEPGTDGSERGSAGTGDPGGAPASRSPAIGHRLSGGARDGHRGGRPDRNRRDRGGLRAGSGRPPPTADRLGENKHRPSGIRSGRRGADQDRAGDESAGHPQAPALPQPQSGDGLGTDATAGDVRADAVARPCRPRTTGGA